MEAHSENLLNMDKLLEDIKSELSVAKSFGDIIASRFVEIGAWDEEGDISNLDNEVLKCEATVDEANQSVLSAEAAIESRRMLPSLWLLEVGKIGINSLEQLEYQCACV